MSNVTFVYYANQSDFETAAGTAGLSDGALYFIADTHKIYRGKDVNGTVTAVDFSEPFALVNNTSNPLPSIGSARIGCLYINTDTYEIKLKPTSSSQSYTTIVPALSTALSDLNTAVSKLTTVYNYKGSVATYAALPASGNVTGDVWNVEAAQGNYPAGTNYAWTGSAWDALGGSVDLSGYVSGSQVSNPSTGEVLMYREADAGMGVEAGWFNNSLNFNHLDDYDSAGGTMGTGEVLTYNGAISKWQPSGYTLPLNSNTVALGTGGNAPSNNQVLSYNGTTGKWTNQTFTATIDWIEVNGN